MNNNKLEMLKNKQGQALILVLLMLLVVFFIVVSISNGVSSDTINSINNQNFQEAYTLSQSTLKYAIKHIGDDIGDDYKSGIFGADDPNSPCNLYLNTNSGASKDAKCQYEVIKQHDINVSGFKRNNTVQSTIDLDDNTSSTPTITISGSGLEPEFVLSLNIINENADKHIQCLIFPSDYNAGGKDTMPDKSTNNGCFGALDKTNNILQSGNNQYLVHDSAKNTYTLTFQKDSFKDDVKYLRATLLTLNTSLSCTINISVPGNKQFEQYEIIATGYYSGSRRTLVHYYTPNGTPPGIFDFVLYNQSGQVSNI